MTLKVAVAGAGYFAQFHLEAWQRLADVDLVAIADRDPDARAAWDVTGYEDAAEMLAHETPDILDIALPPMAHMSTIALATEAGVPYIICQKPFCGGLAGAEEAVAHVAKTNSRVIVHENFRFQPWYRAAAAEIAAGHLGDLQQMTFRLRPGDGQGPRAYLDRQPYFQQMPRFLVHETAVHLLDVFLYLFGPVDSVYADLTRRNPAIAGEDAGHILLTHSSGVRSHFDGNRLLDHSAENCRLTMGEALIEGTNGTLTLSGSGALHRRGFGVVESEVVLAAQAWPGFAGDCVFSFQKNALMSILEGREAETEGARYLDVLRLQEAVYASAERGTKLRFPPQT